MGDILSASGGSSQNTQSYNTNENNQYFYYSNNQNQSNTNSFYSQNIYPSTKQTYNYGYGTSNITGITK